MLETLKIKNIAIIDSAEVSFKKGLNILSGETGAGKSIVIEAISLMLGGRASADLIRTGADEATVEGLFDLSEISWIRERLEKLGFGCDSSELLIKRLVNRSGRHRIYINGELATLSILQDLCDGLVDLCSQHEHQSLLKAGTQLDLLDRFGGLGNQVSGVGEALGRYRALVRERDTLLSAESDRAKRMDYLRFQIEELREAKLQPDENETLQAEKKLLQSAEGRAQSADGVRSILESEDGGILNGLNSGLSRLRSLAQLDDKAATMLEGLERAAAEVEEVGISLNRYLAGIESNPERLQIVQDRLSLIADLRRKYGATIPEMLRTLAELEQEYGLADKLGTRLAELGAELEQAEKALRKLADKLSESREKVAEVLSKSVTAELKDLKMEEARFKIELSRKPDILTWTPGGADQIQFLVRTNRGDEARPLGKIASGGELSRLMLAVRRVIADRGGIGVYLFDEIDAGIGGQTAFQVGRKLKSVAAYNQVICITHQPQIASFADHHLSVRKASHGGRTVTDVVELNQKERKEELARMLGGPELTKKSLENAAELMNLAR